MKTKAIALLLALTLLTALCPLVVIADDPTTNNGLASLEYSVDGGTTWTSVPDFSATKTYFCVVFPRPNVVQDFTVEIRGVPSDPAGTTVEYGIQSGIISKDNNGVSLSAYVCTPAQVAGLTGTRTQFDAYIPTANVAEKDITAALSGSSSGKKAFGGAEKPSFFNNETLDLLLDGLGIFINGLPFAGEPIQGDQRWIVKTVLLDEGTDNLWDAANDTCSMDAAKLAIGDHKLTITLHQERYSVVAEEGEEVIYGWEDLAETGDGGTYTIEGSFTIERAPVEPPKSPTTGNDMTLWLVFLCLTGAAALALLTSFPRRKKDEE